jgi:Ran GTPase-activating protein (RanGAP) involved in mRNA processing and transport
MQSLLENDKITHLNLSNNPKISTPGFKYIAVYIKGSSQLTNLDLSYTQPDKKSIQYITSATAKLDSTATSPSLSTLLLNGCGLRNAQLEVLAAGIRKSSSCIRQLYLRSNRFINGGALSIGVMLRDYDGLQSLERLYLDSNDLSQGIQYIAQALRRNQSLLTLSICDCKIDAKGCVLLGEALVSIVVIY